MSISPHVRFALIVVCFLSFAATVGGQVAVPSLAPASPRVGNPTLRVGVNGLSIPDAGFVPENPAAMQWGEPSRFGMGQFNAESEHNAFGAPVKNDYDGFYAGLRWVTEVLSFGAEIVNMEESQNIYKGDITNAALAFPMNEFVALGAALNNADEEYFDDTDFTARPEVGLAVNLDDRFFIGLVIARDVLIHEDGTNPNNDFNSDRGVQKLGLGFRSGRRGGKIWHLEYYTITREPHENAAGIEFAQTDSQTVVIELIWQDLLIGFTSTDYDVDNTDGTVQTLDLGWVPKKGISLLGHIEQNTIEADFGVKYESSAAALSLAFQF